MRDLTFISYAHEDGMYLEKLMVHLAPFARNRMIQEWSDKRILFGRTLEKGDQSRSGQYPIGDSFGESLFFSFQIYRRR